MANIEKDIKELQYYLRTISAADSRVRPVGIDGIYGDETREAVRNFQQAHSLPVTGNVTPDDWRSIVGVYSELIRKLAPHRSIKAIRDPSYVFMPGDRNDAVYFLQIMLNALARRFENITAPTISGVYDEQTIKAAEHFMRMHDSAQLDKTVWNSISDNYNTL